MGCGVGDVSFLVAQLVGPDGAVVGLDRAASLAVAERRADHARLENLDFVESTLDDFTASVPFDALIGRFFLLYQ